MFTFSRRWIYLCITTIVAISFLYNFYDAPSLQYPRPPHNVAQSESIYPNFLWKNVAKRYPVTSMIPLPTGNPAPIPKIQHDFTPETPQQRLEREKKLAAVKESFVHSWEGYKRHAWLQDEVSPIDGGYKNGFGGWGATLVDSLDTLWIMGMKKEFAIAVSALDKIDFSSSQLFEINIFETTIRYLGGLLSAYDVSQGQFPALLEKAINLGEMLYIAFDTPNRMPVTRWDWRNAAQNGQQQAPRNALLAELGSMSLEFTRLSQLSGDPKYYDAIQRIMNVFNEQQNSTKVPGMWPVMLDAKDQDFTKDKTFTFGGMADSIYEYLPKQHLILGGRSQQYQEMYESALDVAKQKLFYRPLNPENRQMLISGTVRRTATNRVRLFPDGQHLTCFVGGMVGLAAKAFNSPEDLVTARQLVDGCIWAYDSMPTGIMPEQFKALPCKDDEDCQWTDEKWYKAIHDAHPGGDVNYFSVERRAQIIIGEKGLAPGFVDIADPRYILRPEAIESVFIMYRITGDRTLQDKAWKMFQAIESRAKTAIAYAAISDVTTEDTELLDSMESFWTAETLKYFYLIFSEPDQISLDEYVFNTEAHPLRRPLA
ncbi:hypothetical protein MBLNU459_g3961t1 [Dothideomycetes sp. NU459]